MERQETNKDTRGSIFFQILFWGALWGLTEATLGYVLHLIAVPGLAGFIMFSFAYYYLYRAFKTTDKVWPLFLVSLIAASIKLVDFAVPNIMAFKVINPAVSILFEGAIVAVLFKLFKQKSLGWDVLTAIGASVGWRAVFITYQAVLLSVTGFSAFFDKGTNFILRFVLLESIANAAIIFLAVRLDKRLRSGEGHAYRKIPGGAYALLSFVLLAVAVATEYLCKRFA